MLTQRTMSLRAPVRDGLRASQASVKGLFREYGRARPAGRGLCVSQMLTAMLFWFGGVINSSWSVVTIKS
jgi:hypothetical protein